MHPLLAQPRRLAWYTLAWLPVAAGLAFGLAREGGLAAGTAAGWGILLTLLYAALCLPVWYTCRALPLGERTGAAIGGQLATAVLAGGIWALMAWSAAHPNDLRLPGTPGAAHAPAVLWAGVWAAGTLLYLLAAAAAYAAIGAENARRTARLAQEAELRALKAQIRPHFLFNSLNSISALTGSEPARAREMCVRLAEFLRRTLGLGERAAVALEEEIGLARDYIAIEQIRFGPRLGWEEAVEEGTWGLAVPALVLQPLVENAVGHGLGSVVAGGTIRLEAACEGGRLRLAVSNPYDADTPPRRRGGRGLANVRARLEARYGASADMDVRAEGGEFRVTLRLPREAAG